MTRGRSAEGRNPPDWRSVEPGPIFDAIPPTGMARCRTPARLSAALGRRYAIERELGRGGMGTVYLALDRRHGRPVALKVLPPDVAEALGPERFLREIGIVARLSHPNILPLYDSGRAGGRLYYVLPYIGGGSLADRLGQGPPIPVTEAVTLAREIADALAHAHAHGVIHRDVKPDNILLHEGHALLADFGVARAAGDGLRTDSGLAVGTAAYASPEQAAGSRGLDERSDVYGLGCVLYEMLAGPAPRGRDLLARRFTEPLPPPTVLRGEVPSWLDGVVGQALAARPDQRYPTAAAFRDALATPAGAADTGPTSGRRRHTRRRGSRGERAGCWPAPRRCWSSRRPWPSCPAAWRTWTPRDSWSAGSRIAPGTRRWLRSVTSRPTTSPAASPPRSSCRRSTMPGPWRARPASPHGSGSRRAAIWPAASGPERCSAGTTTARATGSTSRPRWWMPGPDASSSRCSR